MTISSVTTPFEGAMVSLLAVAPFALGEAEWTDVVGVVVVIVGVESRESRVDFVDFDMDDGLWWVLRVISKTQDINRAISESARGYDLVDLSSECIARRGIETDLGMIRKSQ